MLHRLRPDLKPAATTMGKLFNCLKLNWRMLSHVLRGRWLGAADYEQGYDRLAGEYNTNWLDRLRPVTDRMLELLPEVDQFPEERPRGKILDLGCGTGYTTVFLEKRYPAMEITGVDLSQRMLREARKLCRRSRFLHGEMAAILREMPEMEYDWIISAWAMGYSCSTRVIRECGRVLKPEGKLLFVVNLRDTLPAVFYAYRRTLAQFPQRVTKALHPEFPVSARKLEKTLRRNDFAVEFLEEGSVSARPPETGQLAWLLKTGILAGFDQVLPLAEDPETAAFFEAELIRCNLPFEHHYVMALGRKK